MAQNKPKLIVITGPTASGKSGLAVKLALQFHGEIVSADSRQVYKGLDKGSGKITGKEKEGVPHYLLDICKPGDSYSVAQFQKDAFAAIGDILQRKKLPFLVGGTALYIYAVIDNYQFVETRLNLARRAELGKTSIKQLQSIVNEFYSLNPHPPPEAEASLRYGAGLPLERGGSSYDSPSFPGRGRGGGLNKDDYQNPRRLIRAIEKLEAGLPLQPKKGRPKYDALILGVDTPRLVLYQKIDTRVDARLENGMIEEVKKLRKIIIPPARGGIKGGGSDDWLMSLGLEYRLITQFLRGEIASRQELAQKLKFAIHAFARRQLTWFRRDKRIIWVYNAGRAEKIIASFLEGN